MKSLCLLAVLALFGFNASAQADLKICTTVQNEYCVFENTKFVSQKDSSSSRLFMMVLDVNGFGSSKLVFNVYSMGKEGKDSLVTSIDQKVEKDWIMAWTPYLFKTDSRYRVEIQNDTGKSICSEIFELIHF